MCASMIGTVSTLAPNLSVPWGRLGVAISGGGTSSVCASICRGAPATAAAAAALPRKARRVTPSVVRDIIDEDYITPDSPATL